MWAKGLHIELSRALVRQPWGRECRWASALTLLTFATSVGRRKRCLISSYIYSVCHGAASALVRDVFSIALTICYVLSLVDGFSLALCSLVFGGGGHLFLTDLQVF